MLGRTMVEAVTSDSATDYWQWHRCLFAGLKRSDMIHNRQQFLSNQSKWYLIKHYKALKHDKRQTESRKRSMLIDNIQRNWNTTTIDQRTRYLPISHQSCYKTSYKRSVQNSFTVKFRSDWSGSCHGKCGLGFGHISIYIARADRF